MENAKHPMKLCLRYFQTDIGPVQVQMYEGLTHPSNPNAGPGPWYKVKEMQGSQAYSYLHGDKLTQRIECADEWKPSWQRSPASRKQS